MLLDLPPFCWYEICKFLTPPELFRLSQSNSTLYNQMFSMSNSEYSWSLELLETHLMKLESNHLKFATKRSKLILDHLNSKEKIAKLFSKSTIHENRNILKKCLAVYLKFKYGNELDSDFLVYLYVDCLGGDLLEEDWPMEIVPFKSIIRKVESQWKVEESDSNDLLLVHGYVDFDGNITIFNIENVITRPSTILVHKEFKQFDIEFRFRRDDDSSLGFLTKFIENIFEEEKSDDDQPTNHKISSIAYQEFIIPNRKLKIMTSQSYWTIRMDPFDCKFEVSNDQLLNALKVSVPTDITYLIFFSMYGYFNVKSLGFCKFRFTTNLLSLPFSYNMPELFKVIASGGLLFFQYFLSISFLNSTLEMVSPQNAYIFFTIVFVLNALCYIIGMDLGTSPWMNVLAPVETSHNIP